MTLIYRTASAFTQAPANQGAGPNRGGTLPIFSTNNANKPQQHSAVLSSYTADICITNAINLKINKILDLHHFFNYPDPKQDLLLLITSILNIPNTQEELKKTSPTKLADLANILGKFNANEECKKLLSLIAQNIDDNPATLAKYDTRSRALLANACGKCLDQAYCKQTLEHIAHYETPETLKEYNLQGLALLAIVYNKYNHQYPGQIEAVKALKVLDLIAKYVCDNPKIITNTNPYGRALLAFALSPYADREHCGQAIDLIAQHVCKNPPTEYRIQGLRMLVSAFSEGANKYPNQESCLKGISGLAKYVDNDPNALQGGSLQDRDQLEALFKQHATPYPTRKARQAMWTLSNTSIQDLSAYQKSLQENPLPGMSKLAKEVKQALTQDNIQAECLGAAQRIAEHK
jgi:hypothetical protein